MHKYLIFSFLIVVGFWGCSAPKLFTKEKKAEDASRILSYEQADVADPLIDSLLTTPSDSAVLKTVLFPPPPPPPPAFKQIRGHRVQVFLSTDSIKAYSEKVKLAAVVSDSVYLVKENGFFKVRVGDYHFYPQADSMRQILAKNNYPKAWIPECMINVPNTVSTDSGATSIKQTTLSPKITHRVQVFVTKDEARAIKIVQQLMANFQFVHYKKVGPNFKIFAGRFTSREQALKTLEKLKARGWSDAFLVPADAQ